MKIVEDLNVNDSLNLDMDDFFDKATELESRLKSSRPRLLVKYPDETFET